MFTSRRSFLAAAAGLFVPMGSFPASERAQGQEILVLGAGIAGLTAARRLADNGFRVRILEGRERAGGRIFTDRTLGTPIDLGASWIHGIERNPVAALARRLEVTTVVSDLEAMRLYNGRVELTEDQRTRSRRIAKDIKDELRSRRRTAGVRDSLQPAVTELLARHAEAGVMRQLVRWRLFSEIELEFNAGLDELALRCFDEGDEFSGDDVVFPGGYDQLVTGAARGLTIEYNQAVTAVDYSQPRVRVRTRRGHFEADRVIVTFPLGVLKANVVTFTPALPERKRQAIERLAMGSYAKIVMRFARPFWPEHAHRFATVAPERDQRMEFFSMLPTHRANVLVAMTAGSLARTLEQQPARDAVATAVGQLRGIFGNDIPAVTGSLTSRWQGDPFARGAYSAIPPGGSSEDREALAAPVNDRLYFAGEATHQTYPSTVHGALLTGEREADRLIPPAR